MVSFGCENRKVKSCNRFEFFFGNINIVLFLVTMIISLFCIWLLRKEKVKNMKMRDEILLQYNKVLSTIQKWFLMSLEKGSGSYQKIAYEIIYEIRFYLRKYIIKRSGYKSK